jgi:DNA-binding NarL/FixJ family response regulator
VLTLIAKDVLNKEIAKKLVISLKTVSHHITNIFRKLQVADRGRAIIRAGCGIGLGTRRAER